MHASELSEYAVWQGYDVVVCAGGNWTLQGMLQVQMDGKVICEMEMLWMKKSFRANFS